jgi:pimeloyl-ACP methyl ester carboxylesterase
MARMPEWKRDGVTIYYEEHGRGFPVLLLAPGGMRSNVAFWERAPWNPLHELSEDFRLIAIDQRNAGRSVAKVSADDGWHVYTEDQLALLDHLGVERCHLLGGCIGSSFALGLLQAAGARFGAAVLQNPIGLYANRDAFYALFDDWAGAMRARDPGLAEVDLGAFRERMYGGDFVFNVPRAFVRGCATPLLILCGSDSYHPTPISHELAQLAPAAELLEGWKDNIPETVARVRAFLRRHTPG